LRRVLIVDDEKKTRKIYRQLLESEDFDVLEAENGKDANLKLIQEKNVDLVLLDIRMPVLSGPTLFNIIKIYNPTAKVIVTSVYPLEDQRRAIGKADSYFDKSEGAEALLLRIKRLLPEPAAATKPVRDWAEPKEPA
jgi:CheY-like chemotaxis protein